MNSHNESLLCIIFYVFQNLMLYSIDIFVDVSFLVYNVQSVFVMKIYMHA